MTDARVLFCGWQLQKLQRLDGEVAFLKEYCAAFESFTTGTGYISELFRYLVRSKSLLSIS